MHKRRHQTPEVVALILLFLAIAAFTAAGFARDWKPPVASVHGAGVDSLIRYLTLATGTILLIGTVALIAFLWLYGRGAEAASPAISSRAERWWSLVPVVGMAVMAEVGVLVKGLPVWKQVYGEPAADAVVVELTAQQFEWWARYPGTDGTFGRTDPHLIEQTGNPLGLDPGDPASSDDVIFRNRMTVAAGRPVYVRLRSVDVLHSFSVPAFRVKQDVVPGLANGIQFVPSRAGTYEIGCAELCGMGHYAMRGRVVVLEQANFDEWLASQTGALQ